MPAAMASQGCGDSSDVKTHPFRRARERGTGTALAIEFWTSIGLGLMLELKPERPARLRLQ